MFQIILFSLCLIYPNITYVDDNVFLRNLVTKNLTVKSILENYNLVSKSKTSRILNGDRHQEVLAFITPWNNDGYRLSVEFGSKFSIIVPVWFQLKEENGKFIIAGQDAINETWLAEMQKHQPHVSIVARLIFEIHPQVFYNNFKQISEDARLQLVKLAQQYKIHGIFIECPNYFFNEGTLKLLQSLAKNLRKAFRSKQSLILMDIPSNEKFHYDDNRNKLIQKVFSSIDFAFISIYELPNQPSMAPLPAFKDLEEWLITSIGGKSISKTLLGLPMFGFDYFLNSRDYVFGNDIIEKIQKYKTNVQWIENINEHIMFFTKEKNTHNLYYPTLYMLNNRFEKAAAEGFAGFGFWELAQGMPYFFDLL